MKKKRKGSKRRTINWPEVKLEYMAADKTVSVLGILRKHNIYRGWNSIRHTKGWVKERDVLHNRILAKTKTQIINTNVKQWENQIKLWKAVESQAAMLLKEKIESKRTFTPRELDNLASAIQKALQSQRLIAGQSTENVDSRSIHLDVLKIIEEAENGGDPKHDRQQIVEDGAPLQNKEQE